MVFFYNVTTGWMFDISLLCKNSIKFNQSNNPESTRDRYSPKRRRRSSSKRPQKDYRAVAYRFRSMPRVYRRRAASPQGIVRGTGAAFFSVITMDQFMCVCVFFPFILEIKFVGRTSRGHTGGRSHRISHPPSLCGASLYFSREKDSAIIPFPRRP